MTPEEICGKVGKFDCDVYTLVWRGRLWLFLHDYITKDWANLMRYASEHGNTTALLPARTNLPWWFDYVWGRAHSIFFLRGPVSWSSEPQALVVYDAFNARQLECSGLPGKLVWGYCWMEGLN